ncbi:unnamed protein product [Cylicocyclus nassatus]|uniref:Hyaluronidase n=1 Tax=Cylicocyclus nassatus TaxID=53992 RepID=A0AA36MDC5_CYLNA|nr:unnamed protein product [Cylicocyclus nassatus]
MLILLYLFVFITVRAQLDNFPVYWNVPSKVCYTRGVDIPLQEFGIIYNKDHEFLGDQIVIFYEYNFGHFPYYLDYDPNQPVNGGLPQKCPFDKHLALVSKQIREAIPREDFEGIAVIDFEEWRPLYELNWGKKSVYKSESLRLVREEYPTISDKSAEELAKKEFNTAARKIFLSTIALARQLRPYARWGFYGFPYCNYDAGNAESDILCSEKFKRINDELSFIYEASSALFPSIYLSLQGTSAQNYRYIQAIMMESARIAAVQSPPLDVYPYTKFEYNPYQFLDSFYAKKDVCNSLKQAADLGARGIILWSTSKNMKQRCEGLSTYVRGLLGPTVALVRKRNQRCREKRCSSHGQCVLPEPATRCTFRMQPSNYVCRCDPLYTGNDCSLRRHFKWIHNRRGKNATAPNGKGNRRGRRRKIKKLRFIKVSGDAGGKAEDGSPATAKAVLVNVDISKNHGKARPPTTSARTIIGFLNATAMTPKILPKTTTLDLSQFVTPPPLDFRIA